MQDLPILELRRIEANIIKPIYEELVASVGPDEARRILARAIRRDAIRQARSLAEAEGGPTSLASFRRLLTRWTANDALHMEVVHESADRFDFNVTRCRYAEMYREMGLGEIGHLLSCERDGAFSQGYDPKLSLSRTQTLRGGASHCNFRYRYREPGPGKGETPPGDAVSGDEVPGA